MNYLSPGLEAELQTRLAQCNETEKSLRSAAGQTNNPELRHYLFECSNLYKGLGELLSFSAACEGSKIFVLPENHDYQIQAWIDFASSTPILSDRIIFEKVAQGHAAAILDIKATLDKPEIPENIAMVLYKGIKQIRMAQNWNGKISDLG